MCSTQHSALGSQNDHPQPKKKNFTYLDFKAAKTSALLVFPGRFHHREGGLFS